MQRYEYLEYTSGQSDTPLIQKINEFAKSGWRLISVVGHSTRPWLHAFFEREITKS